MMQQRRRNSSKQHGAATVVGTMVSSTSTASPVNGSSLRRNNEHSTGRERFAERQQQHQRHPRSTTTTVLWTKACDDDDLESSSQQSLPETASKVVEQPQQSPLIAEQTVVSNRLAKGPWSDSPDRQKKTFTVHHHLLQRILFCIRRWKVSTTWSSPCAAIRTLDRDRHRRRQRLLCSFQCWFPAALLTWLLVIGIAWWNISPQPALLFRMPTSASGRLDEINKRLFGDASGPILNFQQMDPPPLRMPQESRDILAKQQFNGQQQQPPILVQNDNNGIDQDNDPIALTFFLESPRTLRWDRQARARYTTTLPNRTTTAAQLRRIVWNRVHAGSCAALPAVWPIDDFPEDDPYLPWIHDVFVVDDMQQSDRKASHYYNHRHDPDDPKHRSIDEHMWVQFVAQNRRRCQTGDGKEGIMHYWEPQMALFQPVPVEQLNRSTTTTTTEAASIISDYRLASLSNVDQATVPETRFLCHFHSGYVTADSVPEGLHFSSHWTTTSIFPFNYEYISWRKHNAPMFVERGPDVQQFEFSQLMFACPVPAVLEQTIRNQKEKQIGKLHHNNEAFFLGYYLDLIPIRTPARGPGDGYLFTARHVGSWNRTDVNYFDPLYHYGPNHVLPSLHDSGRIANIPLCQLPNPTTTGPPSRMSGPVVMDGIISKGTSHALSSNGSNAFIKNDNLQNKQQLPVHNLVVCTWTSAKYFRRGDAWSVEDTAERLKEWLVFHRMVGVNHVYLYDNTKLLQNTKRSNNHGNANDDDGPNATEEGFTVSPLQRIAEQFVPADFVTYIPWPATVCNNNRPMNKVPGERSSQYAAEASCRERYGGRTEWMSFLDLDEYLVPLDLDGWPAVLINYPREKNIHVLKMRSSRGRPRLQFMEVLPSDLQAKACENPTGRKSRLPTEPCVMPRRNETFLRIYNCDYMPPPRPDRFARAMKQIYRPSFVLSHFVHYSTITAPMNQYYVDLNRKDPKAVTTFQRKVRDEEWGDVFFNEITDGILIHTKTVLPYETMTRTAACRNASKHGCGVGLECSATSEFNDALHSLNIFHNDDGTYCNCWPHRLIEDYWVPKLEQRMSQYNVSSSGNREGDRTI